MDLDQLLDNAAPPVLERTPELQAEVHALLARSEPKQHRTLRGRLVVVGGVLAAVVGLGSVAAAAGLLPGWTMFTTSSGKTCEVSVQVDLLSPGDGEPITSTFSLAEQKETLRAARLFLDDFDYDSINVDAAIAQWRATEARARATAESGERQPRLEGEELELFALTHTVVERMRAELATEGLDLRAISVVGSDDLYLERDGSTRCGQ